MIPWTPIDPETPLSDLVTMRCFADSEAGRALILQVSPPYYAGGSPPGRTADEVRVESRANFGWPRRRAKNYPDYLPVSGVCIAHGLVPRRIVALPGKRRAEGDISFRDLVRNGPPASVRLQGALAMADEVKTTYGRMLADVAYRIEQAALFDSAVPTTRSFDNALAVWNDLDHVTAGEDDVVRLAGTLKLAFDTARAHAETVGLDHLPATARAEARRAAGAARLAVGAKTDGERAAAQEQVVKILRSLALYYLPGPDRVPLQLTGG